MKKKLLINYPEISKQWHPTKNGETKLENAYGGKFWWKCDVADDHEWIAAVRDRVHAGQGCPCCKNKKIVKSNCLTTTHPEIAAQWHPTKNNLTPENVSYGSQKFVWWKCPVADDHEFETKVATRVRNGCPCCSGKKIVLSNCLTKKYPDIIKFWHATKNRDLFPEKFSYGSNKQVWWKCNAADDHEWQTTIKSMVRGHQLLKGGCPYCLGQKIVKSNCLATMYPKIAAQWHPTKNGNLTPFNTTSGKKIWWKCDIANDHEWETSIAVRVNGNGCPCCRGLKVVKSNSLATTHPEIASQWHPTKNNLTANDLTYGSDKKVWWLCNEKHEWEAATSSRTCNGNGCPICNEPRGEKIIRAYLDKCNMKYQAQYRLEYGGLVDFMAETYFGLLAIEFHGMQHYEPSDFGSKKRTAEEMFADNIRRDAKKAQHLADKNIPLLIIPYWKMGNIEEILNDVLLRSFIAA